MTNLIRDAANLAMGLLEGKEPRRAHVIGVGGMAESTHEMNSELAPLWVVASAWLHDVGYADRVRRSGFHPLDGATYLRDRGWPPKVCSLVAFHTGAEYEAEERGVSQVMLEFERPASTDLDLLNMFDLYVGPDGLPTTPEERIAEILRRYEPDSPVHRAVSISGPHLIASAARAKRRLRRWP